MKLCLDFEEAHQTVMLDHVDAINAAFSGIKNLSDLASHQQGKWTSKSFAALLIAGITLFSLALHAWYWNQLPDRVATHFGIDGRPNDWMNKGSATALLCGIQVAMPLFLFGIGSLLQHIPSSMINIPHREYWLHPDRRQQTIEHVSNMLAWIAVLTALEMMAIGHLTFLANRTGSPLNAPLFLTILGLYLLGVFSLAGRSYWVLRKPGISISS
jgi:uncharacterized membrane protein